MSNLIRLEILRPDKPPVIQDIAPGIYPLGSDPDNKVVIPAPEVSGRHAVLSLAMDYCWIEDLDSTNGTSVNGKQIRGRCMIRNGDVISISEYVLRVTLPSATAPVPPPQAPAAKPQPVPQPAKPQAQVKPVAPSSGTAAPVTNPGADDHRRSVKRQIHEELVRRLNLKRLAATHIGAEDLHQRAKDTIRDIINEVATRLPAGISPETLVKEIHDEALGLGPLEDLLADPDVTEIMVNGPDNVYVEKAGKLVQTNLSFLDDSSVLAIIERIVSPLGRRIDESQPYVDARLKDGSRVNAIIHPLSLIGPCLTIRKFFSTPLTDGDLIKFGTTTRAMNEFIRACVVSRKNIVVSGGTGSGKTTLLNVLSDYLPKDERIVTIEDAAELRLTQPHVVSLEARPPNIEGKGAITIRDLVRNALRMRPDRIVVGECRGGEALDMLQAMNTGHDGSLTTVHANSARDVISRLETMVLMSGMDLPIRAIREQVAAAVDVIVHTARLADGSRKITAISEVVGLEGDKITMQDIFHYVQTGVGRDGKVQGHFAPTGGIPTFLEEFQQRGMKIDRTIFDPGKGQT